MSDVEYTEWLKFARMDYNGALKLNTGEDRPYPLICYHCQQTASLPADCGKSSKGIDRSAG